MADWARPRRSRRPHRELDNFEQAVNEPRRVDVHRHEDEFDDGEPGIYADFGFDIPRSEGSHPEDTVGPGQVRVWNRMNGHVLDLPVGDPAIDAPEMVVLGREDDFVCVVRVLRDRCTGPGDPFPVPDARDWADGPRDVRIRAEAEQRARQLASLREQE